MAEVSIREASLEDVAAVKRIAERGWQEAYGPFLPAETIEAAMAWYSEGAIQERMARDEWQFLVAEQDGSVVGFLNGGPSNSSAEEVVLGALYVDPDSWRSGVGSRLMDRFETVFDDRGFDQVTFEVLAANEVGESFYLNRGYERADTLESELFGHPVTEHVFEGRLGGERDRRR